MAIRPCGSLLSSILSLSLLLALTAGPAVAELRCANAPTGFDLGLPTGWSVAPAAGGVRWSDLAGCAELGNLTGGSGGAACASSDRFGRAAYDTTLATALDLSAASSATLRLRLNYQRFSADESFVVEVSRDGGPWEPARVFTEDRGSFRAVDGEAVEIDLSPWAGAAGLELRFRYRNPEPGAWDWYVQIDDVTLACDPLPPCGPGVLFRDRLQDGGFEGGTPSTVWSESSTLFGTPICTADDCGARLARSGSGFAFLGGAVGAAETASLEQSVVLHAGTAILDLHLWKAAASGNGVDRFRALLDGVELASLREDRTGFSSGYRRLEVDASAFADGGTHLLRLEATTSDPSRPTSFLVDDVALRGCPDTGAAPELTIDDVNVLEGSGGSTTRVGVQVLLSHPWPTPVTVEWTTADGLASDGDDYLAASGTLLFPAGATRGVVEIEVRGDDDTEGDEDFAVLVTAASGATPVDASGTVTIVDDDQELRVTDVLVAEGDLGMTAARFVVTTSAPSSRTITLDFATAAGTAAAGSDFEPRQGTVVIAPGDTQATIDILVLGDQIVEIDETFVLHLANVVGARPTDPLGEATILDDDVAEMRVEDALVAEGDAGASSLLFQVHLSRASSLPVSVAWATAGGTASAGADYTAASGTLHFPPGSRFANLVVMVVGDLLVEGDEAFSLVLSSPSGAALVDAEATGTIVDDDTLSLSIADVSVAEAAGDAATAVFVVSMEGVSEEPVEVPWSTRDGSATAGVDYVAASGVATLPPGAVEATITVAVLADAIDEIDETFFVDLSSPTSGQLERASGVATIVDDDGVLADAGGPYSGIEGGAVLLDGSGSTHPSGTIVAWDWDTDGDGEFDDATGAIAAATFADDGIHPIALQVTDGSGEADTATATVAIANAPPEVEAGEDRAAVEGDLVHLEVTIADPGVEDTLHLTAAWGDGSESQATAAGATTVAFSHRYADDGTFPVAVCADDEDGGTACATLTVSVENASPEVEDSAELLEVVEGETASLTMRFSDPGDDVHTGVFHWGDGATSEATVGPMTVDRTIFFADFDDENAGRGQLRYAQFEDWVVERGSVDLIGEGLYDLLPGHGLYLDLDGSTGAAGRLVSRQPLALGAGPQLLRFSLAGSQRGGSDTVTVRLGDVYEETFTLASAEPIRTIERLIDLAAPASAFLSFDHAGGDFVGLLLDDVVVEADCGTLERCALFAGEHTYLDDLSSVIEACVADDDGGESCGSRPVAVTNLPPSLGLEPLYRALVGVPFDLAVPFSDPGILDTHDGFVRWGDGTETALAVEPSGGGMGVARAGRTFAAPASHTVEVCLTDDDGGSSCATTLLEVHPAELDLAIELTPSARQARPGSDLRLSVAVRNQGGLVAHGVRVLVTPPAELAIADPDGGEVTGPDIVWNLPILLPFEGRTFEVVLAVPYLDAFGSELVARATVSDDGAAGADAHPADNESAITLTMWDQTTPVLEAGEALTGTEGGVVDLAVSLTGASLVFQETFDQENAGVGVLNYFGFAHWEVVEGSFDLIGNGTYDFYPGNGLYLDVDGSTSNAGTLRTRVPFLPGPGNYHIEFELGGSRRGQTNSMEVRVDDVYAETFERASSEPLEKVVRTIDVTTRGPLHLVFEGIGADNQGLILDDIEFSSECDLAARVDWGDGSVVTTALESCAGALPLPGHTYLDDGLYEVEVCLLHQEIVVTCDTTEARIDNATPVVGFTAPARVTLGESLELSGLFSDAGVIDTHSAQVEWGDGTTEPAAVVESDGSGTFDAIHAYSSFGSYTVRACVADDEGAAGCAEAPVVVGDAPGPPVLAARKTVLDEVLDGVVEAGEHLLYQVELANVGETGASGVVFVDSLPEHTTLIAGSIIATSGTVVSEDPVVVEIGTLAAGATTHILFEVLVEPSLPAAVQAVVNQGSVSAEGVAATPTDDPGLPGSQDPTSIPTGARPELAATKQDAVTEDRDDDGMASAGDILTYTLEVENRGSGPATEILLRDVLPPTTVLVGGSVATTLGIVVSEDPLEVAIAELGAGDLATVTFEVAVAPVLPTGVTEVSNQASVLSHELPALLSDDPDVDGAADPTVTTVHAAPRLVASKSDAVTIDAGADGVASPGDTLAYTVTVRNLGNADATGVGFVDLVPEHTVLVAGSVTTSAGIVRSEDPLEVTIGDLAAGAEATIDFAVVVADPLPAGVRRVVNQGGVFAEGVADVLTDDPDAGGEADPTVTELTAAPRLIVEKADLLYADFDDDGVASPGDELLYTVEIRNVGNAGATDVVLRDLLPREITVVAESVQASQGTLLSAEPVEVALGTIAGAEAATVTLRVVVADPFPFDLQMVSNQASVTSAELAPVASDDPATEPVGDPTATEIFTPAPTVSLADVVVTEGDSGAVAASFALALDQPSNRPSGVAWATAEGTATAGNDFVAASGVATFLAGETATTIPVMVLGDLVDERDEMFTVTLAAPENLVLPEAVTATATLLDDDEARMSIADVTVEEGDAGAMTTDFRIELSTPSDRIVSASWATASGTAASGEDFVAATGSVSLSPPATSVSVTVEVYGDLLLEDDETFTVELSDPVETAFADAVGLGTILDDEVCLGPELLVNAGAEDRPEGDELPGWTRVESSDWQRRLAPPEPAEGRAFFAGAGIGPAELVQEIDLATYEELVDAGGQAFAFAASVRTADEASLDVVRVVVEYVDAAGAVLDAYDSGEIASPLDWEQVSDVRVAPPTTRRARVRLLASRFAGNATDGFFDALSLRSLRAPTLTVDDVTVSEGQAGSRDAVFTVRLGCAWEHEVTVGYATSEVTASDGEDYTGVAGNLTFPVGETALSVAVPVSADAVDEPDEHFFLELGNLVSAGIAVLLDPTGVGTIRNDDWCPRTPGYWKNHRAAWPLDWMEIGGVEIDDATMMAYLSAGGSDAATRLAHHLVATKLNLARGADPDLVAPSILAAVVDADQFLADHPPGSDPRGEARDEANRLKDLLDRFDNVRCDRF